MLEQHPADVPLFLFALCYVQSKLAVSPAILYSENIWGELTAHGVTRKIIFKGEDPTAPDKD